MQKQLEIWAPYGVELMVRDEDEDGMGRTVLSVSVFYGSKYGQPETAEVNWSAIGSVDVATTETYARMLRRAATIAERLNEGLATLPARGEAQIINEGKF